MLGVNIKDQWRGFFDATVNRALEQVIPRYNQIAAYFRGALTKKKLHLGERTSANTVDEKEFQAAISELKKHSSGSWNPVMNVFNLVRWVFGSSQQLRLQSAVDNLDQYAHQYNSFRFADNALNQLMQKLTARIADIEGSRSKFFAWHNPKVDSDPTIKSLKKAITDWLTPYHQLINGAVEEASFSQHDRELIERHSNLLRAGPKARYTTDLIANFEQVLGDADNARQRHALGKRSQSANPQARRSVPSQLANAI
jgi:hypothetical protein